MRRLAWLGTGLAVVAAAHAAYNLRHLRRLAPVPGSVTEAVSLLVPARDEEGHIARTVGDLLAQEGLDDVEVLVLDDGSTDSTPAILAAIEDPRLRVISGADEAPPGGWLGKPWACQRLAEAARGSVLVFVDADVELDPAAIRAAVAELREAGVDLLSPFPREVAETGLERIVQPMLTWGWVTFLPLRIAEDFGFPELGAANGQCVVVDAGAYRAVDGHAAVRGEVIEDISLARAFRRAGFRTSMIDGSALLSCRMYEGSRDLVDGYSKNVWAAFGGPVGSAVVAGLLNLAYVVPVLALLSRDREVRRVGAVGVLAAIANRALVARATGARVWPDSATHPATVAVTTAITGVSWWRHLAGTNRWKGRPVTGPDARC